MSIKATILVIEDETPIQKFLRVTLETQDYRIIQAATAEEGLRRLAMDRPDLVMLDLGLPDMDGVELTRKVREWSAVPILIVSARGKEQDKVVALDAGADDYITKPFGVAELLARLRVILRHLAATNQTDTDPVFQVGELHVDLSRHEVKTDGQLIHLTPNEFKLLAALIKHAGKVLTHRQLLKEVWGPDAVDESHYLRVYMNQLRQKLEKDPTRPKYLMTEIGVGYRLLDSI